MPKKIKDTDEKKKQTKKTTTTSKKKNTTKKAITSAKKATTKSKATGKTSATKAKASSKASATTKAKKNTTTKKRTTRTSTAKTKAKKVVKAQPVEYYDLPYRYNQTVVKVLSQTPTNLFIYWDISDEDRENYKKTYGDNFFSETKPVLIIYNNTLDYSFEVEINDFANSWYLHVNDSKCDYKIELGRRPIGGKSENINTDYIYISTSNEIETPNDRILFNNDAHMVYFRDVKTNREFAKNISFMRSMGKIYNIYDLYKEIYNEESLQKMQSSSSTFK